MIRFTFSPREYSKQTGSLGADPSNGFRRGPKDALPFWACNHSLLKVSEMSGGRGWTAWGTRAEDVAVNHCIALICHHINYSHKDLKIDIGKT